MINSKKLIDVIDYGGGNTGSLLRALHRLNVPFQLKSGVGFEGATGLPTGEHPVLLPGVGAFGALMQSLNERGLSEALKTIVSQGTPYLGICVGLQVLFDASEESPDCPGLGLLKGQVVQFKSSAEHPLKIPQIGWNRIHALQNDTPFEALPEGDVYFVNSYVAAPKDPNVVLYQADYGGPFCAGVSMRTARNVAGTHDITAFQFHPEKSGEFGHRLLSAWVASVLPDFSANVGRGPLEAIFEGMISP